MYTDHCRARRWSRKTGKTERTAPRPRKPVNLSILTGCIERQLCLNSKLWPLSPELFVVLGQSSETGCRPEAKMLVRPLWRIGHSYWCWWLSRPQGQTWFRRWSWLPCPAFGWFLGYHHRWAWAKRHSLEIPTHWGIFDLQSPCRNTYASEFECILSNFRRWVWAHS